jgi:hypothetical protein
MEESSSARTPTSHGVRGRVSPTKRRMVMRLKEYRTFVGSKCRLRVQGTDLSVYCKITAARIHRGTPEFEIIPVAGYGRDWVHIHRVVVVVAEEGTS